MNTIVFKIGALTFLGIGLLACGDRAPSVSLTDQNNSKTIKSPPLATKLNSNKNTIEMISKELGLIPKEEFDTSLKITPRLFGETSALSGFYLITSTDILAVFEKALDENKHIQYSKFNPYYFHTPLLAPRLREIAALGAFLKSHNKAPYNDFLVRTYRYLWAKNCFVFNVSPCKKISRDILEQENIEIDALEFDFESKISDLEDAQTSLEHPFWGALF